MDGWVGIPSAGAVAFFTIFLNKKQNIFDDALWYFDRLLR